MTKRSAEDAVTKRQPPSWIDGLANATGCAIAVLGPAGEAKYASRGALEALGLDSLDALAASVDRLLSGSPGTEGSTLDTARGAVRFGHAIVLPCGTTVDHDRIVLIGARGVCAGSDDIAIDAALWRAQALLSRHWVHALRGSLNAASLNVALLRSLTAVEDDASNDPSMWDALKGEIRSLDRALTQFLDRSSVEDTSDSGSADLQPVIDLVHAQLEPMAKKRQVRLQFDVAGQLTAVAARAERLHAALLLLCLDGIAQARPRSVLAVSRSESAGGRVCILVSIGSTAEPGEGAAAPAAWGEASPWRDAAQQAARAIGGELSIDGRTARLEMPSA